MQLDGGANIRRSRAGASQRLSPGAACATRRPKCAKLRAVLGAARKAADKRCARRGVLAPLKRGD